MTTVLLDTHTLLWALLEPARLSVPVREILRDPKTTVRVSSACAWEISTKYRLGKLPGGSAVVAEYEAHLRRFRAEELPITSAHALLAGSFPNAHRDPFDRILAAQSTLEGLPLLTNDPAFGDFPVTTVW
jgi:PIN domain nuclease of toxin-antitoxin system